MLLFLCLIPVGFRRLQWHTEILLLCPRESDTWRG